MASRVRSSCVGPSPPVLMMMSERPEIADMRRLSGTEAEFLRSVVDDFDDQAAQRVKEIERIAETTAQSNTYGAIAESWIRDGEGYRVDVSEGGWPI